MNTRLRNLHTAERLVVFSFIFLSVWWFVLYFIFGAQLERQNLYWAATYQIIALEGGILGLIFSRTWGGFKSLMGRAILFFSLGLLFQSFGQTAFSFYNLALNVEIPYPSIADVGFFGSLLLYLFGILSLARISGARIKLKKGSGKLKAFLLPLLVLLLSYAIFLNGYGFDRTPLTIFLDFGYPLGEAVYVSIALLVLLLSKNILGGVMKRSLLFLTIALIAQYCAEFNFLYQALNETWINGGYGDFMYLFAYFLMTVSLIKTEEALRTRQLETT